MSRAQIVFGLVALGLLGAVLWFVFSDDPPPPPRPRTVAASDGGSTASLPDAGAKPPFPASMLTTEARRDCFPPGFRTGRVRLTGTVIELCGTTASGSPRCYAVDAIANGVTAIEVADAPRTATNDPEISAPFQRTELASRGARVSTRGGSLNVTGAGGGSRTVTARQLGFHSYEDVAILPWSDGWYAVLVGFRNADLGASAIIDPATLRMVGHAAILPCDGGT